MDLWEEIAGILDREYELTRVQNFSEMLKFVETNQFDGAVANISITAAREEVMDFSQPIYESGLQIMVPDDGRGTSIVSILLRPDLLLAVLGAFLLLFTCGMLMWVFERRHQEYFDKPAARQCSRPFGGR